MILLLATLHPHGMSTLSLEEANLEPGGNWKSPGHSWPPVPSASCSISYPTSLQKALRMGWSPASGEAADPGLRAHFEAEQTQCRGLAPPLMGLVTQPP